nr:unnamed protein product [Callosobruchus chinensis]
MDSYRIHRHDGPLRPLLRGDGALDLAIENLDMIPHVRAHSLPTINYLGNLTFGSLYVKLREKYDRGRFFNNITAPVLVTNGVPQGSILGLGLWNLYLRTLLFQYADDLCVLNRSKNPTTAVRRTKWAARDITDYYKRVIHKKLTAFYLVMLETFQRLYALMVKKFR